MEKILVDVVVPAAEKTFNVFIPDDLCIGEVTDLLGKVLSDLSEYKFSPSEDCMLFEFSSGKAYDKGQLVKDLPIFDGTKLMLI